MVPTQIGAADRGGQLDLKIVRGLLRGLSALHNTASYGPLIEKDQATAKPNARLQRASNGAVEWDVIELTKALQISFFSSSAVAFFLIGKQVVFKEVFCKAVFFELDPTRS